MVRIFGYGEDALTLWALKEQVAAILMTFGDKTAASNCLFFYRPSFGRSGGAGSAEFGEFDAVIASRENIYLIESKWDNLGNYKKEQLLLRDEQLIRHRVFAWYLTHWSKKYSGKWQKFVDDNKGNFIAGKKLPDVQEGKQSLLATNLEFTLTKLLEHYKGFSSRSNIKNVLLFFYDSRVSTPPIETDANFTLIPIDFSNIYIFLLKLFFYIFQTKEQLSQVCVVVCYALLILC